MKPWVVMRSHDDMPLVERTLAMVARQDLPCRLLVLDNASTDGTRELARHYAEMVIHVPRGAYVPGRILNLGMRMCDGDLVAFLNADCTPHDQTWLRRLLEGFDDPRVAAVFGRQTPRPGCAAPFARDTEAAFGDGRRQQARRHCFSMGASAIRRGVWERQPFDERLHYSEDVEWTWRARQAGHAIRYVRDAVASHSHNYSLAAWHRRQVGEGQAEARIYPWSEWEASLLRYSMLPLGHQILADWLYCLRHGDLGAACYAPLLRLVGAVGRRAGFNRGRREEGHSDAVRAVCNA